MTSLSNFTAIEKLNSFLTLYRSTVNKDCTHTKMIGGKWYIPDEKLEEFYQLYSDVVQESLDSSLDECILKKYQEYLSFVEKPRPLSPIKYDLDFRYIADTPERRYTMEMIEDFILKVVSLVKSWYLVSNEDTYCFITEKPNPIMDTKKKIEGDPTKKLIKDGVHIQFPYLIIPNEQQLHFRAELLKMITETFNDMNLMTADGKPQTMCSVVDKAVIGTNSWTLYGSSKINCHSYEVTRIVDVNPDDQDNAITEVDPKSYGIDELVRLLSMRSSYVNKYVADGDEPETRIPGQLRQEKKEELDKNIKEYKITPGRSKAPSERKKKCRPKILKQDELKITKMLVDTLSPERANDYKTWMEVGWACHNIDERLLEDWIAFSKKCPQYAATAENDCLEQWYKMNDEGFGLGSLRFWAKDDNITVYRNIQKEESRTTIMESINNTIETGEAKLDSALRSMSIQPYDVAKVLHAMCCHEYICVSEKSGRYGMYYHFANHKWVSSIGSILLRGIVSDVIPKTYQDIIKEIVSQSQEGDAECKDVMDEWISSLGKFKSQMQIIRSTNFKNNVMHEALVLFYDKEHKDKNKFLNRLDDLESKHLLGFENGVFDLLKNEFRPGRPEDYISMSTNIEFHNYCWEDEEVNAVMTFISQVLPDEDERDYVLILLSSFLNGNNRNEKFHIWTGSGGNGKSKLIELFQFAIGNYGCILPVSLLTKTRKGAGEASPEMAKLKGIRFAVLQEPEEKSKINVGLMKEMTGGDTIQARALYSEPIEFKPQVKMVLVCNHLPELPYDDEATWRRVRSVEFKSKFVNPEDVDPTDRYSHPKDEELAEKLQDWAEPFMWVLIQFYDKWRKHGLKEPASVIAFTKKYQAQNDQFRDFFDEYIIKDSSADEPMTMRDVYMKYGEWHTQNETGTKRPKKDLQKYLEKRIGQHHMAGENKGHDGWMGYKLKNCDIYDNESTESFINLIDQNN